MLKQHQKEIIRKYSSIKTPRDIAAMAECSEMVVRNVITNHKLPRCPIRQVYWTKEKAQEFLNMYGDLHYTLSDISSRYGITDQTLSSLVPYLCRKYNIQIQRRVTGEARRRLHLSDKDKEEIAKMSYYMTPREISKQMGCSQNTIRKFLNSMCLPTKRNNIKWTDEAKKAVMIMYNNGVSIDAIADLLRVHSVNIKGIIQKELDNTDLP